MSCAQGSPGSEPAGPVRTGPAARPAYAPALQVFRCVGTWMCAHTPGKRVSLVRTAAAPPFRLPCPPPRAPSQFRTVGKNFAPNCPTPQTLALFSGPHKTLGVCGELMSNISATRGHPGMRICVCGSPRGDLSHIAGLTLGRSTERFSGANRRPQDHTCVGGRTDATNRLSENHL
jgi:hypothetical protein